MPASTRPFWSAFLLLLCLSPLAQATEKMESPLTPPAGAEISVNDYLVPGKTVIFSFLSHFSPPCPCVPCEELGDPLGVLATTREDVIVVKIKVDREGATGIDWNSPVALQYGLRRLPHFLVYGPDGEVLVQDDQRSEAAAGRDLVHSMIMELPGHSLSGHKVAAR